MKKKGSTSDAIFDQIEICNQINALLPLKENKEIIVGDSRIKITFNSEKNAPIEKGRLSPTLAP